MRAELQMRGSPSLLIEDVAIQIEDESIRVTMCPQVSKGQLRLFDAETGESLT